MMNNLSITLVFKYFVQTIIGLLLTPMIAALLFPILFVFYVISSFVKLYIKIKYGKKASKASGTDVLSSMSNALSEPFVNIAFRINGQLDSPKFKDRMWDLINNSLDKSGRKRYRRMMQTYEQVLGYSTWIDINTFNIDDHFNIVNLEDLVKHGVELELSYPESKIDFGRIEEMKNLIENPENIDWSILMKVFLNKHKTQPMRPGLPKWDIFLVRECNTRYSALFRFHHSITDGVYFSRMLCEGFIGAPSELNYSYVPPGNIEKWVKYIWSFAFLPFSLWGIIKKRDKNILHGPKLDGMKKHFLSKPLNLDQLRSIRAKTKSSIHGILFSCLSYSFMKHFKNRGENVSEVTALMPIPLQNLKKPIELKNKYAVAALEIPTCTSNASESPNTPSLNRLFKIEDVMAEAKRDPTVLASHSLLTLVCSVLPSTIAASSFKPEGYTTWISSIPGPKNCICYEGDVIEDLMFWIPDWDPLGVAVSLLSYNGHIRVGLLIDKALLECEDEGVEFLNNFLCEVENLKQETKDVKLEQGDDKVEVAKLLKNIP